MSQTPAIATPARSAACFVARYPEWVATVVYRDGHAHHFDGAKDLFKYLLDLGRWAPGHRADDIATIAVTDYYAVQRIDARSAWYVIGSDMLGPMGHELIPTRPTRRRGTSCATTREPVSCATAT